VVKEYANDAIVVTWDATRCIHTARCTAGLPEVFDARRRPWIQLGGADPAAVAEVVGRCPTGALRARRLDVVEEPQTAGPVTVQAGRDGPLYIQGPVTVVGPDGQTITREDRLALCRCGGTANPPFCDNTHRGIGYRSGEPTMDPARRAAASPEEVCPPQDQAP
jgi:uncharacterized Fe-S cluster protein YjdI/CDGSH-type Zn-finger protein